MNGAAMTAALLNSDLARLSRDLRPLNARPAWEDRTHRALGSPALPMLWRYRTMRPQLLRAIDLITTKDAERRVLRLENPGLPGSGRVINSLTCGLQVIHPGEVAPAHRHSQNALRFVIESEGAYTTVNGERVAMHPGDLVLTPGWSWHDHGHVGSGPAIWIDALDTPLCRVFGAAFFEYFPGDAQPVSHAEGGAAARYGANLLPTDDRPVQHASPLLVYPYDRTLKTLAALARSEAPHPAHGIKMYYANPTSGGHVLPTIAAFIQWLPQGFSGRTYRSTDGTVFNVVEGSGRACIGDTDVGFEPHDIFVVPPWTPYRLESDAECVLFSYSDRAAQEAFGFWREEDPAH
jgi:gentisate 1,2-dioxygenase